MVRIPRLQQIQETAQPGQSTGRINLNVPNQASNILQQTNAVAGLAEKGADIFQAYEDDTIEQFSDEGETELTTWKSKDLERIKQLPGDPTDAYVKHDDDEKAKVKEILGRRADVSDRVRRNLASKMIKTQNSLRADALTQGKAHKLAYKHTVYTDKLKLKGDRLTIDASLVDPSKPTSTLYFDQTLNDIVSAAAKYGLSNGTVTKVDEKSTDFTHEYIGPDNKIVKVKMTGKALSDAAEATSEGVKAAIDNLIASGYTDKAKMMTEKYKAYLDPKGHTAVLNKLEAKDKKQEAFSIVNNIEKKPEDQQEAEFKKIKDPEVRADAEKIYTANKKRRADWKKDKQDKNYDTLSNAMIDMRRAGQLKGIADLEKSTVYGATWDNMSPKQKRAIEEEFNAPKKSDQGALVEVNEFLAGEDVSNTSFAQFEEKLVGLSKADKDKKRNTFFKKKDGGESFAASNRIHKTASDILKRRLIGRGIIELDDGKVEEDDKVKLNKAYDDLELALDGFDTAPTRKEVNEYVDKYIKEARKEKVFWGSGTKQGDFDPTRNDFTAPTVSGTRVVTQESGNPLASMSNTQIEKLRFRHMKAFGLKTPISRQDPKFIEYVRTSRESI